MPGAKRSRNPWRIAAFLAPQVVLILLGAWWYSSTRNSLENNGRWVSTKAGLARNVMGAQAFFSSSETLAGEELDLGRWFGCQELLYGQALSLEQVCFDFLPAEDAYLSFVFEGTGSELHGVRLSTNELYPDCVFTASSDGEYLSKTLLSAARSGPLPGTWSRLCVSFDANAFAVELDGRPLGRFEARFPERQRFGFRNGAESVRIDEIEIREKGRERALVESFVNWHNLRRAFVRGLIGVVLLDVILLALLRRRASLRKWIARVGALGLGLLIGSGVFFAVWRTHLSRLYRGADEEVEFDWRREEARRISKDLNEWYGNEDASDRMRVLVLGGSQTWGSGAADKQHTLARTLERLLNQNRPEGEGMRYQVINGGVSGLFASWLFELYRDDWIDFDPELVVLNVSSNDTDLLLRGKLEAQDFVRSLEDFVTLGNERGIKTLFSLEPNSIEKHPEGLPLHTQMRAVAQRLDVPLVDTHAYLAERYDTGILWWDFVHPTSYGHRLIAEALAPAVRAVCEGSE